MIVSYFDGLSCPVCTTPFTPDDDIVVCPQCGLPHHRACWKSVGHCHDEANHGTAHQWSRDVHTTDSAPSSSAVPNANICPKCHTENAQYAEFCSRCGYELSTDDWHSSTQMPPIHEYAPHHSPFVGTETYSADEEIGGIATEDLANMIGVNMTYYIPRFQRMDRGGSGGWNWCAFLIPHYWLFYRKQYLLGAIYLFVALATSMLCNIISAPVQLAESEAEMLVAMQNMQNHFLFYPCLALVVINLALAVLLGVKGNHFYYNRCRNKILSIKQKTPDLSSSELRTYGGVSIGLVILVYMISQIATMLLSYFLSGLFYI